MTAPITSNGPITTRLHHYAGRYCDEYGERVPHTLRLEEQKSAVRLVACAECRCSARSHAAGGSTPSLGL